jgi:hypothetical protein
VLRPKFGCSQHGCRYRAEPKGEQGASCLTCFLCVITRHIKVTRNVPFPCLFSCCLWTKVIPLLIQQLNGMKRKMQDISTECFMKEPSHFSEEVHPKQTHFELLQHAIVVYS